MNGDNYACGCCLYILWFPDLWLQVNVVVGHCAVLMNIATYHIAKFRTFLIAHSLKGDIMHSGIVALIPSVDMTAEHCVDTPVVEFLEHIIQFLSRQNRRECIFARTEEIGVGEHEYVPVLPAFK